MKYKKFNQLQGVEIPVIGFGCWSIGGEWNGVDDAISERAIHAAIEVGVNFFDTAPVYGLGHSETVLGRALKGVDREKVMVASKCGLIWDDQKRVSVNLGRESLLKEIDQVLQRLGLDYVDIWQCHWPDSTTPIEETMSVLEEIKTMGKIKHIGLSNYSLEGVKEAMKFGEVVSFQGLYNLLEQNPTSYHGIPLTYAAKDEMIPFCEENGMMYLPYSPLMQGVLTGCFKYTDNFDQSDKRAENPKLQGDQLVAYLKVVDQLKEFANSIGKPLVEIAINWLVQQAAVGPVIAGLDKPEYAASIVGALEWELNDEMLQSIAQIINIEGV